MQARVCTVYVCRYLGAEPVKTWTGRMAIVKSKAQSSTGSANEKHTDRPEVAALYAATKHSGAGLSSMVGCYPLRPLHWTMQLFGGPATAGRRARRGDMAEVTRPEAGVDWILRPDEELSEIEMMPCDAADQGGTLVVF